MVVYDTFLRLHFLWWHFGKPCQWQNLLVNKSWCRHSEDKKQWEVGRVECMLASYLLNYMIMSSIGNIFWITGPLWQNPLVTGGFPHKGQWYRTLMFSLICTWTNCWVNNWDTGDFKCHHAEYDVTVMIWEKTCVCIYISYHSLKMKHCRLFRFAATLKQLGSYFQNIISLSYTYNCNNSSKTYN